MGNRQLEFPVRLLLVLLLARPSFAAPREDAGPGEGPEPFQCCDVGRLQGVVEAYLTLVEALAAGEPDGRITSLAYALRSALKPDRALDDRENEIVRALEERVSTVRNSAEDVAAALPAIGRDIVFLALRHGGAGSITVVEAYCPERGPWLQRPAASPKSPWGGDCARWR